MFILPKANYRLRVMEQWGYLLIYHLQGRACQEESPQRGRKRTNAWSLELMATSEHLDTAMSEGTPWIFQLRVAIYSPFCISHFGLNFCHTQLKLLPDMTNSYPLRLSSSVTSSQRSHQLLLPHCWFIPLVLCHDYPASIWSLDRDLLKGQGPHSHSWQYPQLSNGAQ